MDTGNPDSGTGTIAEAASVFEKILEGKSPTQNSDTATEEGSTDEVETQDASAPEDETPSDEDGADEEEATDDEGEPDDDGEPERLINVKIDGTVQQIPESEVAKGYQRQADYSRNMQAVAEGRRAVQQQMQEVQQERLQYAQLLPALHQQIAEAMPREPNWDELYRDDPLEYVRLKEVWRENSGRMQAAEAEMQRLAYMQEQEHAQELQARVYHGRQQLFEYNPSWKDKATWDKERVELRQYLGSQGFSEEEISQAYDPRAVQLADKARQFDALMKRKPQAVRMDSPKPATGGTAQSPSSRKHTEISKAKMRLSKTGSVSDAAALFQRLL